MKKILGLDLGSASIGWAVIEEDENNDGQRKSTRILGMGSRIIPYDGTEGKDFAAGTGESRNAQRTKARTARKGYDRYQLRRKYLVDILLKNNLMPGEKEQQLSKMELWALRSKAVNQIVTLQEFGRILLWLNQKRGYKSSRSDANLDKKDTDYVKAVKSRHEQISEAGLTIGQYFYMKLCENNYFRVKENVFPREAYIEEFDAICQTQQRFHENLRKDLLDKIRNEIIYYQRPLKSQKGLVSVCDFEGFCVRKTINGREREYFVGPKVAHRSSPLFQLSKIWENINNIRITKRSGEEMAITSEQKMKLFEHLDSNEKLTQTDLLKILSLRKGDCFINKQLAKGLNGNTTKAAIRKCFNEEGKYDHLLRLEIKIVKDGRNGYLYDSKTGEVLNEKEIQYVHSCVEKEPLYQLWHTIYSISDVEECGRALQSRFNLDKTTAEKLSWLDFTNQSFGNKSVKAIRKILPYLMQGDGYSEAMSYAGYDHSHSLTSEQNVARSLLERLPQIQKNSLRQPVVEKILNQMVNVVNAVLEKHGKPDEIRIELARELKQSKEERSRTEKEINQRERENKEYAERLAEYGLRATRNNLIKWRLYQEINNVDKKFNAICIYCGQPISLTEAIKGTDVDIEHIIPKSKLFDDSQSNKTLAHRKCNSSKGDRTAYDFMRSKSEQEFNAYVDRVNNLYENNVINRTKRNKLLMTESKIPDNFIDRQLRESQYISKKAKEILQSVCHHVWCTSGNVTSELRYLWGWNDVLMDLQLPKYKEVGLTEFREWESGQNTKIHKKEVIKNWTKRDDHRHHAIDALTIACTKQGFIQRFNTLNSNKTREDMFAEVEKQSAEFKEKLSLLEKYIISQKPVSAAEVEDAAGKILISYKPGKRVAVKGTRKVGKPGKKKVVQSGIIVPRGALSEESVYGRIRTIEQRMPVKYLFENPHLIFKSYIRSFVEERIAIFNGNTKKALSSVKKDPIYLDDEKTIKLEYATCFKEEYVIKYKVDTSFNKTDKVIDQRVRQILQARIDKFEGKAKEAFKDKKIGDSPAIKWYEDEGLQRPIHSVRCFTGLLAVVPAKKDQDGRDIGFVKPGNNHHIAIYKNAEGKRTEHLCTFWHAVERKKYGFPVVIEDSTYAWDIVQEAPEGTLPDSFLELLPEPGLSLELSMQQNEMFILGMTDEEIDLCFKSIDSRAISDKLYRVQKIATKNYVFRHHLETELIDDNEARLMKRFYLIQSFGALFELNPKKIRVDYIGEIVT